MSRLIKPNFQTFINKNSTDPGVLRPYIEATGLIAGVEVGEAVSVGQILAYDETSKAFIVFDPSDQNDLLPVMAMALEAATADGDIIKALIDGYVRSDVLGIQNRAYGTITISGDVADNDYFTIGGVKYVFTTDGTITGDVAVDVSGAVDKVTAQAALLAAMALQTATKAKFAWGAFVNDVLTLYAQYPLYKGTEGNALTLVKSGTNLAVSAATLANGNDGGMVWASETPGALAYGAPSTASDVIQRLGVVFSPDELIFKPSIETSTVSE